MRRALVLLALVTVPATAYAADPLDAGAGDSTYGCVESIPRGAQKPVLLEHFPTRGTSGWAATLSITVRHGKGEKVLPSGLNLSHAGDAKKLLKEAGFAIPEQDASAGAQIWTEKEDPQKPGAVTHLELPLVLLPPNAGRNTIVLPRLPVAVARANGEIMTMCTMPHPVVVDDPIANVPDARPVPNPPPLVQREEWTALKKALGWGALGLALGSVIAWFVYKRVTKPKPPPPPPPPRPPWEVALEKLDEVRHAGLLEVQRHAEYFDRVSDAVRGYLGARFGFDGLESTTDEILASLKKQGGGFIRMEEGAPSSTMPTPGVPLDDIARFLRECDLVKFAKYTPSPEECAKALASGETIVKTTMPGARPPSATSRGADA